MALELIKGNAAVAEAALRAGLEAYFGYPITPKQNLEHPQHVCPVGQNFVCQLKQKAAINMVYGAACEQACDVIQPMVSA